ncbi:hypothetical protein [Bordetella sp. 2513F-2]
MEMTVMEAAQLEKTHAEIAKLMAETSKINAEARKLTRETVWYPLLIATGLVGSIVALTKLFL